MTSLTPLTPQRIGELLSSPEGAEVFRHLDQFLKFPSWMREHPEVVVASTLWAEYAQRALYEDYPHLRPALVREAKQRLAEMKGEILQGLVWVVWEGEGLPPPPKKE